MSTRDAPEADTEMSLLDLVIQTAPDAIVTIDRQGSILSFSPAAVRMFGYSEGEVIGQNVSILMPAPHRSQHDGYIARYLRTGEKRIIGKGREVRACKKNGDVFVVELAVGEHRSEEQHVFTGFIRDVSDRVEAERRASRLQRMLDRVSRIQALGEMSTALAHEINQPLAAISNFARASARILARTPPEIEKARTQLDRIAVEAQRASEILKRMRRLIDHGKSDVRVEDMNSLVREGVALSRIGHERLGVKINYDLSQDLPRVMADRIQIQQVIINLLRNAVESVLGDGHSDIHIATEPAHPVDTIKVRASATERNEVMVTIGDGGPGIPEEIMEHLFDPFVTTKESGLGIGLAICRTIIDAHGGRIWAEANPEGGADFHFTLPAADA